jgi:cytochrome c551/c552
MFSSRLFQSESPQNLANDVGTKFSPEEARELKTIDEKINAIDAQLGECDTARKLAISDQDMDQLVQLVAEQKECE